MADTQEQNAVEQANKNLRTLKSSVNIEPNEPDEDNPTLQNLQEKSKFLKKNKDKGFINEDSGSSIVLRESGQVNLAASQYSQYKLNPNGVNLEQSVESGLITNRRNIKTDEIIINNHKMNNNLWDLTDMKSVKLPTLAEPSIIGNFTVYGSVLVKAWEPELKRYMLIRRPCRMPLFSPRLNVPDISAALGINDPLKMSEVIYAYDEEKGYQVNKPQSDLKSLIGKQGVDRAGINRNIHIAVGQTAGSGSSGGGGGPAYAASNLSAEKKKEIFEFFKKNGYDDIAACGVMGRLEQEHHWQTDEVALHESAIGTCGGLGIAQWQGGRIQKIKDHIVSQGKSVGDLNAQLDALVWEASNEYGMPGRVNGKSTATEACRAWTKIFEVGNSDGQDEMHAEAFYKEFVKK